ncbi:MAG: SCO family protein [Cyclobacteriaceae bacterium]
MNAQQLYRSFILAARAGYPFQVRQRSSPTHFGPAYRTGRLSTAIPGRDCVPQQKSHALINNTKLITTLSLSLFLLSCNNQPQQTQEENKADIEQSSLISDESIFNLTSKWNTEEGQQIELNELKGKVLVMVMIYTSCRAACPRLVADMQNIEKQIPEEKKKDVRYVLVSIDPENDTPPRLKAFAIQNKMDGEEWTFLQGDQNTVREFANVLSVKYQEIAPMDFSHSNIISVFNQQGELVHQQEGLGVDNKETIANIIETAKTE